MKRILNLIAAFAVIISLIGGVHAAENPSPMESNIIYFENGDYIIVDTIEFSSRSIEGKTGKRGYTYYDNSGVAQWRAELTGSFTYTGVGCACTAASCDVIIYNTNWYLISKSADRNGNTATGTVTMGYKFLGVTIDKETLDLILTCDVNGNLS